MPPSSRRTGRTEALLKAYVRNNKGQQRRALLRRRAGARIRKENPREHFASLELDTLLSDSSLSSDSDSDSESHSDGSTSDSWSDILGPDWRFLGDIELHHQSAVTLIPAGKSK
jgi:hypothetical protein